MLESDCGSKQPRLTTNLNINESFPQNTPLQCDVNGFKRNIYIYLAYIYLLDWYMNERADDVIE